MDWNQTTVGDIVVLEPKGRLDSNTSNEFQEKVLKVIDEGYRKIVIDLKGVEYISSSGLRVFLQAAKRLGSLQGRIVLSSFSKEVKEVFDVSGFSALFTIASTTEEALRLCG